MSRPSGELHLKAGLAAVQLPTTRAGSGFFAAPSANKKKKKKRKEKNLRGGRSASSGGLLALQTCPGEGDRGRRERRGVARPSAALPAGRALHLSLLCQSQSSLWISVLHYSPLLFQISPPKEFCRCFPTQSI